MPGLPGAAKSASTLGLWAIFQASACSRPPPPIKRIRITFLAGPCAPLGSRPGGAHLALPRESASRSLPAPAPRSARAPAALTSPCHENPHHVPCRPLRPARLAPRPRSPRPATRILMGDASFGLALVGRLDELEVRARDPRPGAARVEFEVALPVLDRLLGAFRARERAREVG